MPLAAQCRIIFISYSALFISSLVFNIPSLVVLRPLCLHPTTSLNQQSSNDVCHLSQNPETPPPLFHPSLHQKSPWVYIGEKCVRAC